MNKALKVLPAKSNTSVAWCISLIATATIIWMLCIAYHASLALVLATRQSQVVELVHEDSRAQEILENENYKELLGHLEKWHPSLLEALKQLENGQAERAAVALTRLKLPAAKKQILNSLDPTLSELSKMAIQLRRQGAGPEDFSTPPSQTSDENPIAASIQLYQAKSASIRAQLISQPDATLPMDISQYTDYSYRLLRRLGPLLGTRFPELPFSKHPQPIWYSLLKDVL